MCIHVHIDIRAQLRLCSPTYDNLPYTTYYVAHIRMLSNINRTQCRGIISFLTSTISFLTATMSFLATNISFLTTTISFLTATISFLTSTISFLTTVISFLTVTFCRRKHRIQDLVQRYRSHMTEAEFYAHLFNSPCV